MRRPLSVREQNLARVLDLVERSPGTSRAAVAVEAGLTRATVSSLVESLIAWGFVADRGPTDPAPVRATAGRPGVALEVVPGGAAGLGIEINVDYLAACLVDLTGSVRVRRVEAGDLRASSPEDAFAAAARLAAAVLGEADRPGGSADPLRVVGASVAVPGLVGADGRLVVAPNLDWRDVDVVGLLRAEPALAALPMTVDNEANCAATAELAATRGPQPASFLHVSGEIGIGAALVLDGTILRGTHGWAGELGHMSVDPDGPSCSCGSRGCLEQYAGQDAILRSAGQSSIAAVVASARRGDARTVDALEDAGSSLGVVLASAVNLLDLTDVVLGGTFNPLSPWMSETTKHELDRRVMSRPWTDVTVRASSLGADAAVVGAASSVVRAVVDDPATWAPREESESAL